VTKDKNTRTNKILIQLAKTRQCSFTNLNDKLAKTWHRTCAYFSTVEQPRSR